VRPDEFVEVDESLELAESVPAAPVSEPAVSEPAGSEPAGSEPAGGEPAAASGTTPDAVPPVVELPGDAPSAAATPAQTDVPDTDASDEVKE